MRVVIAFSVGVIFASALLCVVIAYAPPTPIMTTNVTINNPPCTQTIFMKRGYSI
jgi:hypothetical protein